ncbi:MAG: lipocalin family protein, partial [Telluria sp.]
VYWEGAVTVSRDGKRLGRGYLEMTGYVRPMKL